MSKKLIIIISSVLGLLLVALIGYYFIIQGNQDTQSTGIVSKFRNFFPFGGNNLPTPTTPGENNQPTQPEKPQQPNFTQKLRKLSTSPVSGAGILDAKAGSIVRYIEKATGHIYEVEMFSSNQSRISNTTIPVVYDAVWGNKNTSLIARYLKDDDQTVDTYSLIIKDVSTSTENTISGIVFPANISDVSVFGTSVFYLEQTGDSSAGFTSNFDGSKKKQIWNSPIKELNSQYVNVGTVALTSKPAQNLPGFLYFVDTGTGSVKKVLGNIPGLSTLTSPDASQVLYLIEGDGAGMFVYNQKNKISSSTTPTTFPEKCVWSKKDKNVVYCATPKEIIDGSSLTLWYKGFISFADDIWKYDLKSNTSSIIENLSDESLESIDVIKPILSDNEQYLIFMNKRDNALWSLDLSK